MHTLGLRIMCGPPRIPTPVIRGGCASCADPRVYRVSVYAGIVHHVRIPAYTDTRYTRGLRIMCRPPRIPGICIRGGLRIMCGPPRIPGICIRGGCASCADPRIYRLSVYAGVVHYVRTLTYTSCLYTQGVVHHVWTLCMLRLCIVVHYLWTLCILGLCICRGCVSFMDPYIYERVVHHVGYTDCRVYLVFAYVGVCT